MATGIPTGAPATVIVSAMPTAINASASIMPKTRPVITRIVASSFHAATKGHKNHGVVFASAITFSLPRVRQTVSRKQSTANYSAVLTANSSLTDGRSKTMIVNTPKTVPKGIKIQLMAAITKQNI